MNLESITNPSPSQSPQLRYASLHRCIEKGIASDATWAELTQVCVELGLRDEAVTSFHKMEESTERFRLQNLLIRHGLIVRPDDRLRQVTEADSRHSLTDDVQEAVQFLADGQMPVTVTVATATFPLVVGLGGFMTSTSPSMLTMAIALLPAVLIFMAVGALARRVLIDSAMGIEDAPALPQPRQLWEVARHTAVDAGAIGLALFGPVLVLFLLDLAASTVLPALALACALFPMALMLRLVRGDWQALHPQILVPAMYRGGRSYLARVLVVIGMFAPAALCWWASSNAAGYLQLALVGPLAVAPVLVCARLLGRFLHTRRSLFRNLMDVPQISGGVAERPTVKLRERRRRKSKKLSTPAATAPESKPTKRVSAIVKRKTPAPATAATRQPAAGTDKRPTRTHRTQPQPRRSMPTRPRARPASSHLPTPPAQSPAVAAAAAALAEARAKDQMPEPRTPPEHQPAAHRTPGPRRSPPTAAPQTPERPPEALVAGQPSPPAATKGPTPAPTMLPGDVIGEDIPDLLNMPGFRVVKGNDRDRAGASSK